MCSFGGLSALTDAASKLVPSGSLIRLLAASQLNVNKLHIKATTLFPVLSFACESLIFRFDYLKIHPAFHCIGGH